VDLIGGLKIVLIAYLLALAAAAALGVHRGLLGYPIYLAYSLCAFLLYATSFGRLRLAPRARNFGSRQRRRVRSAWRDWRERRALDRGERLEQPIVWHTADEPSNPNERPDVKAPEGPWPDLSPSQERPPVLSDYLER